MPNFGDTERYIKLLFEKPCSFVYDGVAYEVIKCGKPAPGSGECKTDVYVLGRSSIGIEKEFKISIKQSNADFLENKISLERAKEILGETAQELIENSIRPIRKIFSEDFLVYFNRHGRTEAQCIKMGWKFEFLNRSPGGRGAEMQLTDQQKIDIYAGTNLNSGKRNCLVNGEIIPDSGVANYIIEVDRADMELEYYLECMKPIEKFATGQQFFFACKALNYRNSVSRWDGNRPLAIYVDWSVKNGELYGQVVYDKPLSKRGNEIGLMIQTILEQLGITPDKFDDLANLLHKDVRRN